MRVRRTIRRKVEQRSHGVNLAADVQITVAGNVDEHPDEESPSPTDDADGDPSPEPHPESREDPR